MNEGKLIEGIWQNDKFVKRVWKTIFYYFYEHKSLFNIVKYLG